MLKIIGNLGIDAPQNLPPHLFEFSSKGHNVIIESCAVDSNDQLLLLMMIPSDLTENCKVLVVIAKGAAMPKLPIIFSREGTEKRVNRLTIAMR